MKTISLWVAWVPLLELFCPIPVSAQALPIPQTYIQGDRKNWSWVATTQAVLQYFDVYKSQEEIGDYGTNGYDVPNFLHGNGDLNRHGVDQILFDFGAIQSVGTDSIMPPETVYVRINYFRVPVLIRWAKEYGGDSNTGPGDRIVVIKGAVYREQKLYLMLMDPIDGTYEKEYDWVVRGAGHSWKETLDIVTTPPFDNVLLLGAGKSSGSKTFQILTEINLQSINWDGEHFLR